MHYLCFFVSWDLVVYYCVICTGSHGLKFCRRFRRMTPQKRRDVVERLGYCTNCLTRSHNLRSCTSMEPCLKCNQLHYTLLHPMRTRSPQSRTTTGSNRRSQNAETQLQHRQHRQHQHRQRRQHPHHYQPRHHHRQQRHQTHQRHRHQQRHQPQQRHLTPQPPATNIPPTPDQHILAEAIKTLANVLCFQSKKE